MRNILFYFAGIPIYTYGFMISIGLLFATIVALREAKRRGIGWPRMFNYILEVSLLFLFVGRLVAGIQVMGFSVLLRPWILFTNVQLGINHIAGILVIVIYTIYYVAKHNLIGFVFLDSITPPLVLIKVFAYLGSNMFGPSTEFPWAVRFGEFFVHPLPLYYAIGYYIIFTLLWRNRRKIRFDGQLFLAYIALSSWLNWGLSFWRVDDEFLLSPLAYLIVAVITSILLIKTFSEGRSYRHRQRNTNILGRLVGIVTFTLNLVLMVMFFYWRVN